MIFPYKLPVLVDGNDLLSPQIMRITPLPPAPEFKPEDPAAPTVIEYVSPGVTEMLLT
jgi:hypothetical protein